MKTRRRSWLAWLIIGTFLIGSSGVEPRATVCEARSSTVVIGETTAEAGTGGVESSLPVANRASLGRSIQSAPVMFVGNVGQFAEGARFQVRGGNGTIYLAEDAIWYTVFDRQSGKAAPREGQISHDNPSLPTDSAPRNGVNIKVSFPGANQHPVIEPFNRLETHVSYLLGSDRTKWHSDVPVWGGVRYKDLYPGIDLEVTGEDGRLVERVVARPEADLSQVYMRAEGADAVELAAGGMRLRTAVGEVALPLLQVVDSRGGNSAVPGALSPQIDGDTIAGPFSVGSANGAAQEMAASSATSELVYSAFFGGSDGDPGYAIAVDTSGAAYITGETRSSDFPVTPGANDSTLNGLWDAFVVKLNNTGTSLSYVTFLGGSDGDIGYGIAVGSGVEAYVVGVTYSSDFPVTAGAYDTSFGGVADAFVVKLDATGSDFVYSTYLGGSDQDYCWGIAVDTSEAAYVTGVTGSADFPVTTGAFDTSINGSYSNGYYGDVLIVKLNATGSNLVYSTFVGGGGSDVGRAIAVNTNGAAYVTGWTGSSNFPVTSGAYDTSFNGDLDAFVVKLNAAGSNLAYATFLGGSSQDIGYGIAVETGGAAYVTGLTASSNLPVTPWAYDTSFNGRQDAFAVKLNATGSQLAYATFLGGHDDDKGSGIVVDTRGAAYVVGETFSNDFPVTSGAYETSLDGITDTFVVKLNSTGTDLAYATLLGGDARDAGVGIAFDTLEAAYITGWTYSSDFPVTPGAVQKSFNDTMEVFVLKLAISAQTFKVTLPAVVRR